MAEQIHPKSCLKCFYNELDPNIHPCVDCFEGSKWVDRNIYIHKDASKPLSEAIKEWVDVKHDDDVVNKPKHYTEHPSGCLLYTSPSPRDGLLSRMPSSA